MLRKLFNGVREVFYPAVCAGCKAKLQGGHTADLPLCHACRGKIKKNLPPFCFHCGRQLEKRRVNKNLCLPCLKNPGRFDRAFSPYVYDGVIKEMIHEFKYRNKEHLGRGLSRLLTDFIGEYSLPMSLIDLVIPVPLHKARLREREFNQSQVLAEHLARSFGKPCADGCLVRHRHTKSQASLEAEQRLLNVKDSFLVVDSQEVKNKHILLVDDVLTTGATSSEAAGALKDAGAGVVFVMALAN